MTHIVLGSRSPRRLELLSQIVPAECIDVLPPLTAEEAAFDDLTTFIEIKSRLLTIATDKWDDVHQQLMQRDGPSPLILTADTVVLVSNLANEWAPLGKPPEDHTYDETVRWWFERYYAGRSHYVLTAFVLGYPESRRISRVVSTELTFRDDVDRWLEWYISTGEPRGKAGGYAIQGRGHIFVTQMVGSFSNVVGLPLEELIQAMEELGVSPAA